MPTVNTQSSNQLNTIISVFELQAQELGTVKKCATEYQLKPHEGATKYLDMWQALSAYSLSDGVDITQGQSLAATQYSYTPSEVGGQVVITDRMVQRIADPKVLANIGTLLAHAYAKKEDQDGCSQFSSFTITLGGQDTVCGIGHWTAAETQLRVGGSLSAPEPAPGPYHAVFHPCSLIQVADRIVPLASTPAGAAAAGANGGAHAGTTLGPGTNNSFADDVLKNGVAALDGGLLGGFRVYRDANISTDANTDAVNSFFSEKGLIHVTELAPTTKQERDESLRATEINFYGSYAWGVYRPAAYGIAATFDASLPTS